MEPIFDFRAQTVGWMEGGIAFGEDGHPVVFFSDGAVFAADSGHYLGRSDEGVFRDHLGCIVAFLRGSVPYAALTMPQDVRLPPIVQFHRVPDPAPVPAVPPHRMEPLITKSSLSWERFVAGCEPHWPWKTRC